jgi:hypothetical protein
VASVQPVRVAEPILVSAGGRPSFLLPAAAILLLIAVLAVMLFLFVI